MENSSTFVQTRSFSSVFISKVLALFALAVGVSGLGVYLGYNYWMEAIITTPFLMFGLFIGELLLILTSKAWSKTQPLNYLLFIAFTFISGLTVVPLLTVVAQEFHGFGLIYRALFASMATFLAAALVGARSERPLLGWTGFLTTALIGMLITSLIGLFFPWGNTFEMLFSGFGVLIFAGYAAVDMNRLRYYPENEYIMAAIQLYLDLFNLFIFILRLTGALSRR